MEHSEAEGEPDLKVTPTQFVAQRMRELRRARGWSADRLVEELAKHGVSWNRGVVTKLETGRRESVSVAELLGLASAFSVMPLTLLPLGEWREVEHKVALDLLIDRAASGEPDYDLVPQSVDRLLSTGLITPEDAESVFRIYGRLRERRKANYDAMKGEE